MLLIQIRDFRLFSILDFIHIQEIKDQIMFNISNWSPWESKKMATNGNPLAIKMTTLYQVWEYVYNVYT